MAESDDVRAAVIMLHGRGSSGRDILTLARYFDAPGLAFTAPDAPGGAWYPQTFMAPTAENEPFLSQSLATVHDSIDAAVENGIPYERIVLLGFSQGGCLASTAALMRPRRYGGIIALSAGLIGPPGTVWPETASFADTPAFFGCSDRDPHIPEQRVRESAAVYERMGATVDLRIYPGMGHTVNDDEIESAREIIQAALA